MNAHENAELFQPALSPLAAYDKSLGHGAAGVVEW
jgi:hypothetical protein